MDYKCEICQREFKSLASLHRHVKADEKTKLKDFYANILPEKRDLLTGEKIKINSNDQYWKKNFINKDNLYSWMRNPENKEKAKDICYFYLKEQAKKFSLSFSQAELYSSQLPDIDDLDVIFKEDGGYYSVCQNLGMSPRLTEREFSINRSPIEIMIDTREQTPFSFRNLKGVSETPASLVFGDYCAVPPHDGKLVIERKSLGDFVSTFSMKDSLNRFSREVQRARDEDYYIVVLCEESLPMVADVKFGACRATGIAALAGMRQTMQFFDNIQFVFPRIGFEPSFLAERILRMGKSIQNVDLQYLHDKK